MPVSTQSIVPLCQVKDITPAWIESVLNIPIRLNTFKIDATVTEGNNGFLSNLVRIEFEVDPDGYGEFKSSHLTKYGKHYLIVKLVPDSTITENLWIDRNTELKAYTDFCQDVVKEIPDFNKYICDIYHTSIQETNLSRGTSSASVIVMKDLRPDGFSIVPFSQGYDPSLFAEGQAFLARLHAGTRCLEKGRKLPEVYPWLSKWFLPIEKHHPGYVPQLYEYFSVGFKAAYKIIDENSRTPNVYLPAYRALELHAQDAYQVILRAGQEFPCGVHGLLWSPNILINRNAENSRMKIIDWQYFGYADPAFDLAIYILTTLPLELIHPVYVAQAVRSYYGMYSTVCRFKELPVERSFDDFEKFFNTYGIAYYLYVFITRCFLFSSMEDVQPKLVRLLELFVEMDVLNFLMKELKQ